MRRTDRDVTNPKVAAEILNSCKKLNYGFYDGTRPYVVPMSFGWDTDEDGRIRLYSHCAKDGRRLGILKNGFTQVAVSLDTDYRIVLDSEIPCKSGAAYRSLLGFGEMRILTGEEKLHGLEVLYKHLAGIVPEKLKDGLDFVEILCLTLDEYSCKICVK